MSVVQVMPYPGGSPSAGDPTTYAVKTATILQQSGQSTYAVKASAVMQLQNQTAYAVKTCTILRSI